MSKQFTVARCRLPVAKFALAFSFCLLAFGFSYAQPGWIPTSKNPVPDKPKQLVNDWAGMLSASDANALEQKLDKESDSTSTQIAVLTINELNGYDISSLAFKIGDAWGIGGPDQDNGVLILVSKNEHAVFIATGKGMEGPIPDVTAKKIIENIIVPNFKTENYYGGLDQATDAVIKLAAGEFVDELGNQQDQPLSGWQIFLIIVVFIFIAWIFSRINGGGRGGYISRRGFFPSPWIGGGFGSGGGGFGGGGGGFGGFGGGSFGGGGAGGRW